MTASPCAERDDLAARLRARALLDEQELAAREVRPGTAEQHRDLERERDRAVEVLVQAVVAAGGVAQQQRRRPLLAARGAAGDEGGEVGGKALAAPERAGPALAVGASRA